MSLSTKQIVEYERMEDFILSDLIDIFNQLDNKIEESDFSNKIKREIRGKMAFGICQTLPRKHNIVM